MKKCKDIDTDKSIRCLHELYQFLIFLLLLWALPALLQAQQVRLWGLTAAGGEGGGAIVSLRADGSDFQAIALPFAAGSRPTYGHLLEASDGKLYGLASGGGKNQRGVLFEYDPTGSGTYTVKYHFYGVNGSTPYGSLIEWDGKLYGMTAEGGDSDRGVIFEYDPGSGGDYVVKHHFSSATGCWPVGSLLAWDGKFYGLTASGGNNDSGVLFEYDPVGNSYTVKYHFSGSYGRSPNGRLLEWGGKLYGLTREGGSGYTGVLFEYDPAGEGSYVVKYEFSGINGSYPFGSLIEWGGKFYGMTAAGGNNDEGILFAFDPAVEGSYTVKHYFNGTNGRNPYGSLITWGDKLYGMTSKGGSSSKGVLFEYDPTSNSYAVKHHFNGTNGASPRGSLMESGGKFYGMTYEGGVKGSGVVFEYDPAVENSYAVKINFSYSANGGSPLGSLMELNGKFYGTTYEGGSSGNGVIFQYDPTVEGSYTAKHYFNGVYGGNPHGSLIESGGKLYGMTYGGGSTNFGVLFEYDPAGSGSYAVRHHFNITGGGRPYGSLIEWGGKLYGMTSLGGNSMNGVIFEYDPAGSGNYTVRHHFNGIDGSSPNGSLMEWNGKFYGMTDGGGGVIFEYDPAGSGNYKVKYRFNNANGNTPHGSLIEWGGKFYGMTLSGGSTNLGVIFEYNPAGAGSYVVKHHFGVANGNTPYGSLVELSGKFYGMTFKGGNNNVGVIFEYDPTGSGSYTVLKHLGGSDGEYPGYGHLIAVEESASSAHEISASHSIRLYPNPTAGELNVELSSYLGRSVRIEVYNVQGQLLYFKEVDKILTDMARLDLTGYKPGMYIVKVQSEGLPAAVQKFVVQ